MKIIILAAGIGSRLGYNTPKALVKLNENTTVLDSQLIAITKYINISEVLIVTGFKKDLIMNKYPNLNYIENKKYETTNTSKSLLKGLELIGDHEDIIYINGDVVFDPEIIELILDNRDENLICVNNAHVSEEEVKYNLGEDNSIKYLSKTVSEPLGEAIGINYISRNDMSYFINCLEECNDTDYHERAVELAIDRGIRFSPLNIGRRFCIEIDFEEDLDKAKRIFNNLSHA